MQIPILENGASFPMHTLNMHEYSANLTGVCTGQRCIYDEHVLFYLYASDFITDRSTRVA